MIILEDAKTLLRSIEKLDVLIRNKLIEKQQWKEIALGITASMEGDRVQSSGSPSKMAEAVIKCIAVEDEINSLIDSLIDTKKRVIEIIEQVDSPIEYGLLHRRYIQYQDLQDIADHYGKEYGWATTTHGRALKSVQEIIPEVLFEDGRSRPSPLLVIDEGFCTPCVVGAL